TLLKRIIDIVINRVFGAKYCFIQDCFIQNNA
ncbi:MAG: hypothetical protein ACI9JO_001868, partial [Psychrobacter okhotskensis]